MEKLVFKEIIDETSIDAYLDKVENHSGVRLPMSYVRQGKIVGVYLQNKLVAGYMLITKPSFRSLMFVPDAVKKSHPFFSQDSYEMMEVNGLWIGPGVKSPKHQFQVWLKLVKDIFMCKKKFLLLMSNSRNKTIEHIHSLTNPEILYSGKPQVFGTDKTHENIRIGYTTRWRAIKNIPAYYAEFKKREQRVVRANPQPKLLPISHELQT
ncbi:MAG: hypothetical protein RKH07_02085 [Gammaproteobacteria bacterium]